MSKKQLSHFEESKKWFTENNQLNLETLLEEISVLPCDDMVDDFEEGDMLFVLNTLLSGWYAVATNQGIIAYFGDEKEALGFRLNFINRLLNC